MKNFLLVFFFALLVLGPAFLSAQQHVAVMSRCGGVDTVIIPNIIDNDQDGMDDRLEQKLLDKFMPAVMMFSNENCPGPALDGTGDTNLIAARISPYPGQYTRSTSLDSVLIHPIPVVASKHLYAGLIWYDPFIMVHCAVLYGQDCGALGHSADVEGFHFSLRYIGPDTLAGWMYDTIMTNWMGVTIQSIAHDATLCQHIETRPYKSILAPTGVDSVYASPNKHGNYLTIGDCNSSFICNPNCNSAQIRKNVVNVNVGEPWASLVPDMGAYYPAYVGNDPWSSTNFLNGGAGTIAAKMERPLSSDFASGQTLTAGQICPLYFNCFGAATSAVLSYTCSPNSYYFFGQNLTAPGVYSHVLTSSYGCDSTIYLTLSVFNPSAYSFSDVTCQGTPYNFNGQQLNAAGVYYDTISNAHGCDSAITLTLSVVQPAGSTMNASTCAGSSYTFGGQQLSAPGIYMDTLNGSNGCDSVVTLSLVVDSLPVVSWSSGVDTVAQISGAVALSGGSPAGGVYTGAGVSGNYFYPDSAGAGAHVVTYTFTDSSGCSSTATKTYIVVVAGIQEFEMEAAIKLFPNPANEELILQSALFTTHEVSPVIYDVTGKAMFTSFQKHDNRLAFNVSALAPGMYWVGFKISGVSVGKRFVKVE